MRKTNVNERRYGYDNSGKTVEIKIVINEPDNRLVLHFYNTSMKLKIDGKKSEHLVKKLLIPAVQYRMMLDIDKINKLNEQIISTLGGTNNSKNLYKKFPCNQCNYESTNVLNLTRHKISKHKLPIIRIVEN